MNKKQQMNNPGNDLKEFLNIAHERERNTHTTIWEIEKHFTWWISVIYGILALILTSEIITWEGKYKLILLISLIGFIITLIGLLILEKEGYYFLNLARIYHRIITTLKIHEKIQFGNSKEDIEAKKFLIGEDVRKKKFGIKISVRFLFKFLFIIFIIIFLGLIVYSIYKLI